MARVLKLKLLDFEGTALAETFPTVTAGGKPMTVGKDKLHELVIADGGATSTLPVALAGHALYQDITQELTIQWRAGQPPTASFTGARDARASLFESALGGGDEVVTIGLLLTQTRVARRAAGLALAPERKPKNPNGENLPFSTFLFQGGAFPADPSKADGIEALVGWQAKEDEKTAAGGTFHYFLRKTLPYLVVAWVPDGVDFATPTPYHVFLHPNVEGQGLYHLRPQGKADWPLLDPATLPPADRIGDDDLAPTKAASAAHKAKAARSGLMHVDLAHKYMMWSFIDGGGSYMVWRHARAGKKIVFLMPVGSAPGGMGDLLTRPDGFSRMVREVNFWLQAKPQADDTTTPVEKPQKVGRVALLGYSAGCGYALQTLVQMKSEDAALAAADARATPPTRTPTFYRDHVGAVFIFDGMGKGADGAITAADRGDLVDWYRATREGAPKKSLRIYTQFPQWVPLHKVMFDAEPTTVLGSVTQSTPGPFDRSKELDRFLFVPKDLWFRKTEKPGGKVTWKGTRHIGERSPDEKKAMHQVHPFFNVLWYLDAILNSGF